MSEDQPIYNSTSKTFPLHSSPVELKLLHDNFKNGKWNIPDYATDGSAAVDILAAIDESAVIQPQETQLISSGLSFWIKDPNLALIMIPRSGAGCKLHITLGNTVGLIDSDYQGELKMCLFNKTNDDITIEPGQYICQVMLIPKIHMNISVVNEFSNKTDRGEKGFGHSRK